MNVIATLKNDQQKAVVRGGAPFVWSAIIVHLDGATDIDLIQWIADNTFLTEKGTTTLGILVVGAALNVAALAKSGGWLEKVVKILPGAASYK